MAQKPLDRYTPANPEAEQALLGAVLLDVSRIGQLAQIIKPEHFYAEKHGWIWAAILALYEDGKDVDFITLPDELEKRKQLAEIGGGAYVMDLINLSPSPYHAESYAEIIYNAWFRRNAMRGGAQIVQAAGDESQPLAEVQATIQNIANAIVSARKTGQGPQTAAAKMTSVIEFMEQAHQQGGRGIPTGFKYLDELLGGGLQDGDLVIIGARPSMGKTSLALAWAKHAAKNGVRPLFFSLEMSTEMLLMRLVSSETDKPAAGIPPIPYLALRSGRFADRDWDAIIPAAGEIAKLPLYIDDHTRDLAGIIATATDYVQRQGIGIIFVDYLQLVRGAKGNNRTEQVSTIAAELKGLARRLNVPIVALSQITRAVESRQDKRPTNADLRESGDIENTADVVMMFYREGVYSDELIVNKDISEVIITKQRNGPLNKAFMLFNPALNRFREVRIENVPIEGGASDGTTFG